MFNSVEDIYEHIGSVMFKTLPEQWAVAWVDVDINIFTKSASNLDCYLPDADSNELVNSDSDSKGDSLFDEAFPKLYELFQKSTDDVPWNRCRFILHPDGDFELEFKRDRDLDWLNSLDPEKDLYPSSDIIQAIRSWDGLDENAYRPWFDPDSAMFKKD